jgi:hypothetical protein
MAYEHAVYQVLHLQIGWWITLQILQITLYCLCVRLVFRMITGRNGIVVLLSKVGLIIFLLCSLTYAGLIGIGTGLLVAPADAGALAARVCLGAQSSIVEAIASYSDNLIGTGLWALGIFGWMIGSIAALLTTREKGRPIHLIRPGEYVEMIQ